MSDTQTAEIKAISRLLSTTAELAEQATLTGGYEDGKPRCIHQYNVAVAQLEVLGAIPKGFFLPLPEEAGFGSIGVACAQLASYIGKDVESGGSTYHGPKYNILNQHEAKDKVSHEELQELRELRDMLRREQRS